MRLLLLLVGLLLALGSLVTGCGAFLMGLSFVEPPHPSWGFVVATAPPGPQRSPALSAGEQYVWMTEGDPCTLTVRRADGRVVGTASGTSCQVSGKAAAGEIWSIEATGAGANRQVHLGLDESVFPPPLLAVVQVSVVVFLLGIGALVLRAFLPKPPRPA